MSFDTSFVISCEQHSVGFFIPRKVAVIVAT